MRYGVSLFWEECTQATSSLNFESDVYIEDYDKRRQDCSRGGGVLICEPMRETDIVKVSGWGRTKKGTLKVADESRRKWREPKSEALIR